MDKLKGDLTWSLIVDDDNIIKFRSEAKKRNSEPSFTFETDWLTDIADKAYATNMVPSVIFSGKFRPLYTMIDEKVYYSLFGHYAPVKIIPYPSRGKTNISINWRKSDQMLGGDGRSLKPHHQLKAGKGYTKQELKIVKFEAEINMYMMLLDLFIIHLKESLGFAETRYF